MRMAKSPYQIQLEAIIAQLQADGMRPTLLLHACCAPCSSYVLEYLANFFEIAIYYYNPNIHPQKEFERRLQELRTFLNQFPPSLQHKIQLIETQYNPQEYFAATKVQSEPALQVEAEKGERCRRCYLMRMKKSAEYASAHGYDYFTTTLSISPHKDATKINTIGFDLEKKMNVCFLPADFKKNNGFKRSLELSSEYNLYRQEYCGCIYSLQNCK